MSRQNSILKWVEHEQVVISSGSGYCLAIATAVNLVSAQYFENLVGLIFSETLLWSTADRKLLLQQTLVIVTAYKTVENPHILLEVKLELKLLEKCCLITLYLRSNGRYKALHQTRAVWQWLIVLGSKGTEMA